MMGRIKDKYIDIVKSRVDICQLVFDLCPETELKPAGHHRKKCCCVFHSEKTPSLFLDTTMNRYKCFGCGKGGDVISFVEDVKGVDFMKAIEILLELYCPDIDIHDLYTSQREENDETQRKSETMYIYNQYALEYFVSQYEANTQESEMCRRYTELSSDGSHGRWEKEFCRTFGIGYSPLRGNQFYEYAKKKGLDLQILVEMGLLGEDESHAGQYYDTYRGRVMIPQRDKRGRVQTFTARSIYPHTTVKYLNGRDCLIYKKSTSLFGIDIALRVARQTGKVYLVEGAPDVLRLQSLGIANVVATLGGSWTKEQLSQFSSFACSLCFIPDSDVVKDGEEYGRGDTFVFANGKLAMELGYHVMVREIPSDGKHKEDADSYITSIERWESLKEQDFVLWYAHKCYKADRTNDEQLRIINDICDILICIQSQSLQASLLSDLKAKYRKPSVWKSAISEALRRKQEKQRNKAIKKYDELAGYRFFRRGNHYYDLDVNGKEREWSNFVIRPLFLIMDDNKPTRIMELENENQIKRTLELHQADVTKLDRFKEKIEGKGDYRFFEKAEKYELLKAYIYGKTEEAQRVIQLGWNNVGAHGFYAFCNGIIYQGQWQGVDEYGIIRLENENFYLPALSKIHQGNVHAYINERRFMHDPKCDVSAKEYFTLLHELYGDNGIIAICFYLATLYRDIIIDSTRSFPVLNIYGKKGTGKTEFALSLINLFQRNPEVSNLDSTTYYGMGEKCAEVNNMLVHFDEYKNSLSKKHIDFLKGIYDSAGRIKRSSDGERREATNVNCGVILTGQEMPTADIALFSRVIFLEAQKSERTREETDKYHKLIKLRNMCPTNITVELQRYRDNFNAGWYSAWQRAIDEIKDNVNYNVIGERFINNWSMMLATYYCLHPLMPNVLPFSENTVKKICLQGLEYQHSLCSSTDELAVFWSLFSKCRQLGELREMQDYKISLVKEIKLTTKGNPNKQVRYEQERYILFVREKICIAKANIEAKREGKEIIPDDSLVSYLMSSPEYLGKTKSPLKFYIFDEHGNVKRKQDSSEHGILFDQERTLAFDYKQISDNYDINLLTLCD